MILLCILWKIEILIKWQLKFWLNDKLAQLSCLPLQSVCLSVFVCLSALWLGIISMLGMLELSADSFTEQTALSDSATSSVSQSVSLAKQRHFLTCGQNWSQKLWQKGNGKCIHGQKRTEKRSLRYQIEMPSMVFVFFAFKCLFLGDWNPNWSLFVLFFQVTPVDSSIVYTVQLIT